MKTMYVCSPYRGDIKTHKEYARHLTKAALNAEFAPVTPHLYMTECLDDSKANERETGLAAALAVLAKCDALVFGNRYGVSSGMETEIKFALEHKIPVYWAYQPSGDNRYEIVDLSATIKRLAHFVKTALEAAADVFNQIAASYEAINEEKDKQGGKQ